MKNNDDKIQEKGYVEFSFFSFVCVLFFKTHLISDSLAYQC